ncbi:hypothetical protein B9C88_09505 [Brevibacillus laterosporus]|uniref:DUF1036 domain-containing protein n=1 Tax=Brevibacillus laterosporus TaxID=1465 RepID=UPI000BCFE672|nr:DUF1036 domain-containing protein [Brevibacillus laterosporus]PCN44442.1 hypothetical protein B9C88_09505 [Brevibacillus laterosporus]
MALTFRNETGRPLWVAIAYWDDRCTGSKWRKEGWWKIGPRSNVTVYTGPTKNRKFYYFAHNEGYKHTWPEFVSHYTNLPSHAFSRCWDEPGGERRGMGSFTASADQYTMELYI